MCARSDPCFIKYLTIKNGSLLRGHKFVHLGGIIQMSFIRTKFSKSIQIRL